ncbi:MAG: sulfite exporter TauE/SafE family protein [Hyphomonadaceae bacterium JAD_PAG50586_4]|nr:MAG: sulfite exporter TauE/SafE family protein [Hyphomonadaceae bacterium JAD_PAG50586_4]
MSAMTTLALLAVVLITATISGVFGMAGGLMLMGALTLVMPVAAAMVTHGAVQLVSNGWRAVLHSKHIAWPIIVFYGLGSAIAAGLLALVTYEPTKAWVYLLLGLVPGLAWLPKGRFNLDAAQPTHAIACGLSVTGLNVLAGVSGPLLDVFFVRTALTRHAIVATKAATQAFSHSVKMVFYGAPMLGAMQASGLPSWYFFVIAAPLAMLGAYLGGKVLDRMSDVNFLKWTRWIVTAVGVLYLAQAVSLFAQN